VRRLEDLQFTLNEGACMQAVATGHPVLVVVEQCSVRALFALPLQWGAEPVNLFEAPSSGI